MFCILTGANPFCGILYGPCHSVGIALYRTPPISGIKFAAHYHPKYPSNREDVIGWFAIMGLRTFPRYKLYGVGGPWAILQDE